MVTPTATTPESGDNDVTPRKAPSAPDMGKVGKVTLEHAAEPTGASAGKLEKVKEFVVTKLIPCLFFLQEKAAKLYDVLHPYLKVAFAKFELFLQKYVDPYGRKEVAKMVSGLAMMFFGGFFITTIAVAEAVMQGGYQQIAKAVATLAQQTKHLREQNKKDDKLDENNDGIPDVQQISKQELAARKMYLYLKCSDPEVLSEATQSLYTVFVCVVATLRLRSARAISLGAAIGDVLLKPVQKFVLPKVKPLIDEDIHKWLRPGAAYMCRLIGVSFAMYLQRLLSVFHTAIRGARLFTDGLTELSQRNGFSQWTEGKMDDIGAFALAGLGIYAQLFVFPFLPFLIKLLLFPATFTEWVLTMFVSAAV